MAKLKEVLRRQFNEFYYKLHANYFGDVVKYKDSALGSKCFIVGSGPSLRAEDLELIRAEGIPCFGTNRLYQIYPDTKWRADYYVICDQSLIYDKKVVAQIEHYNPSVFFINKEAAYEVRSYQGVVCPVEVDWNKNNLNVPNFSVDCAEKIFGIGTVTYCCLQLAVYMGFKEIYLLRMDNRYAITHHRDGSYQQNENQQTYFANLEKENKGARCGAVWEMNIAYAYAKKMEEELGFKVYNVTRGGYLERLFGDF